MSDKTTPLIGYSVGAVATWLGVTKAAVSNWLARWPEEVPVPAVVIAYPSGNEEWGWTAGQRAEWEAFRDARAVVRKPYRKRYASREETAT